MLVLQAEYKSHSQKTPQAFTFVSCASTENTAMKSLAILVATILLVASNAVAEELQMTGSSMSSEFSSSSDLGTVRYTIYSGSETCNGDVAADVDIDIGLYCQLAYRLSNNHVWIVRITPINDTLRFCGYSDATNCGLDIDHIAGRCYDVVKGECRQSDMLVSDYSEIITWDDGDIVQNDANFPSSSPASRLVVLATAVFLLAIVGVFC